jgi:hypothetical protein
VDSYAYVPADNYKNDCLFFQDVLEEIYLTAFFATPGDGIFFSYLKKVMQEALILITHSPSPKPSRYQFLLSHLNPATH